MPGDRGAVVRPDRARVGGVDRHRRSLRVDRELGGSGEVALDAVGRRRHLPAVVAVGEGAFGRERVVRRGLVDLRRERGAVGRAEGLVEAAAAGRADLDLVARGAVAALVPTR